MGKDYNISRTLGQCTGCEKALAPGEAFVATVRSGPEELLREDYCTDCWPAKGPSDDAADMLGTWRSRMAKAQEKKKRFVDDELLINFFERLEGAEDAGKIQFRFVLALLLMRKKILVYDRSAKGDDGQDVWTMHFKGAEQTYQVIDPHMDEEKISEVSQQLGQILEGEL